MTDKSGKEDNVILKRGIFRIVRKTFGKESLEGTMGKDLNEVLNQLSDKDR